MLRILVVSILSALLAGCSGSSRLEEIVRDWANTRPRSTRHPRIIRRAPLLSPRNNAAHLRRNHAAHPRQNHAAHPRQNRKKQRNLRFKALLKSKLEFDRVGELSRAYQRASKESIR